MKLYFYFKKEQISLLVMDYFVIVTFNLTLLILTHYICKAQLLCLSTCVPVKVVAARGHSSVAGVPVVRMGSRHC